MMINKSMERALKEGECLAVDKIGKLSKEQGFEGVVYELPPSMNTNDEIDADLCIVSTESWIWSVGVRKRDKKVFASTSSEFYQHPDYECIWLR